MLLGIYSLQKHPALRDITLWCCGKDSPGMFVRRMQDAGRLTNLWRAYPMRGEFFIKNNAPF